MENPFNQINIQLQDIKEYLKNLNTNPLPKGIEIISQNELSKRLGLSKPTIIRWGKKAKIPFFKVGESIRYNWHSVIDALENQSKNKKGGLNE